MEDNKLDRLSMLLKWYKSESYQSMCMQMKNASDQLITTGSWLYSKIIDKSLYDQIQPARFEYASGGNIHRGFYCPSLVIDFVVGNASRGRILKRVSRLSKISHVFCFDENDILRYTKYIDEEGKKITEYLFVIENCVYGITVNDADELLSVSEEVYENTLLMQYTHLSVISMEGQVKCYHSHCEKYSYQNNMLISCVWEEFEHFAQILRKNVFEFSYNNENMVSYSFTDLIQQYSGIGSSNPILYCIRKRKSEFDRYKIVIKSNA